MSSSAIPVFDKTAQTDEFLLLVAHELEHGTGNPDEKDMSHQVDRNLLREARVSQTKTITGQTSAGRTTNARRRR